MKVINSVEFNYIESDRMNCY